MTIAEKQEKIREHIKQLIADKGINMAEISRNENYKNARIFALGVRGDSMNLTFPPEKTTLICCPLEDWIEINPETSLEGKYIIAYRRAPDGTCEATVKKYTRIDETTVILVAESSNPDIKPIILHPDSNEYEIAAVVIGDLRIY